MSINEQRPGREPPEDFDQIRKDNRERLRKHPHSPESVGKSDRGVLGEDKGAANTGGPGDDSDESTKASGS